MKHRIGIVGARGHTGAELIRLLANHPGFELAFVTSRELEGQALAEHNPGYTGDLHYSNPNPAQLAEAGAEGVILALPNGKAGEILEALDQSGKDPVIVDLSADHRFDSSWYYGLPEITRDQYQGQRRIANPGCYATAMQLAIWPMLEFLAGPPQCFGVSGYSGAGTTPSDKNNPDLLRDNLMPYALANHIHEREVSARLGLPVEFMPHVAPHFRGITVTVNLWLREPLKLDWIKTRYEQRYAGEALVKVIEEAPWVSRIAGRHHVEIGGFTLAPGNKRLVLVATEDNLLKGAATQAVQNLNRAFGFEELTGIPLPESDHG